MLDEFQTRYLAILKNSPYIKSIAKPGREIVNIEYYCYNAQIGTVAAPLVLNVPQTTIITTQSDSDFAIAFIAAGVYESVNNITGYNDNITIQIQDQSTGKFFFNIPTVMGLVTGAGGFPFVLPAPRVINPNANIAITVMNRDATQNQPGMFIAFHGSRIYYK